MKESLKLSAQLLKSGEFDAAFEILGKEADCQKSLYWLSLLCRYKNEYD